LSPPEPSRPPAAATASPPPGGQEERGRQLGRSIVSLLILGVLIVALLLAVPGLNGVAQKLRHAEPGWIALAVALEFLSCVGYVLIFELVFHRTPRKFAARLAWSELAFGAAVSVGGAGSLALGAWVLRSVGVPTSRIAERSAVLFLATSAINVFVLIFFGVGLATGVFSGPSNVLLGVVPAAAGTAVLAFFLALPALADRVAARAADHRRTRTSLRALARTVRATEHVVFTPDWRLVGAFGYLLFDIAVLWACFGALGHTPPIAAIVLAYQIGYLANIVPLPGGVGVLDGGLIGMLVIYGVPAIPATAAVLAYHAIALWVPTAIGTIAFMLLRRQIRRAPPRPAADTPATR
jgi:uncharacterized protein (TIRG00374 family)